METGEIQSVENKDRDTLRQIWAVNVALKREKEVLDELSRLKRKLSKALEDIRQVEETRYTGWYVLLKRAGEGWECVGVFNPEKSDGDPGDWDLSIPIADPATTPEFQGW